LDSTTRREIEWDCTQLITRFYGYLDEKQYDALADLFLPDGAWVRLGEELVGPEGIKARMAEREDWMTAHVLTNVRINVISENEADSVQYITLYRHEGRSPGDGPAAVVLPLGILRHTDKMMRTADGWKFKRKASRAIMVNRERVTIYDKK
jgi:hypothetical protein